MRRFSTSGLKAMGFASVTALASGCNGSQPPDAYGNFEATEVTVSAQTAGQIEQFNAVEGMRLDRGATVALVDTTQLELQREQLVAQRGAANERARQASRQLDALVVQRDISRRAYERTARLHAQQAATSQQLDQAERDYHVLQAQIEAARAQSQSVRMEATAARASEAQIAEHLAKSTVINPQRGTVLTVYARAGEVVQPGVPLYRIANLDTLVLRAYVGEPQLTSFRVGQAVNVHVDGGNGRMLILPGRVSWVSSASEFTPTPVQTRDERANLVYAVKVLVANPGGVLKIGMPADLSVVPAPTRGS